MQLDTPSDLDLELLSDESQPLATTSFGAALEQMVVHLSQGLEPVQMGQQSLADGIEIIVRWLNSLQGDALAGW